MPDAMPQIVVVEDDASMSQAIERILRAGGFVARIFDTAEAALESDAASTADCLVLDIHLPGMSGFDLYRRLGGKAPPVIFITARDDPGVRQEATDLGASFLPKPFSGHALLGALLQAIGSV
jgi:DNA-binding response OmpR family regulator